MRNGTGICTCLRAPDEAIRETFRGAHLPVHRWHDGDMIAVPSKYPFARSTAQGIPDHPSHVVGVHQMAHVDREIPARIGDARGVEQVRITFAWRLQMQGAVILHGYAKDKQWFFYN